MDEILNEKRLSILETKIDNISDKINDISEDLRSHVVWEENKYREMDDKYSGKWVEKVAIGLLVTILSGLVLLVYKLILK